MHNLLYHHVKIQESNVICCVAFLFSLVWFLDVKLMFDKFMTKEHLQFELVFFIVTHF